MFIANVDGFEDNHSVDINQNSQECLMIYSLLILDLRKQIRLILNILIFTHPKS